MKPVEFEILIQIFQLCSLLTAAIFVAQVREAPHVGQIDGEPDHGQQKVHLAGPCFALVRIGQVDAVAPLPRAGLDLAEGGHRQGDLLSATPAPTATSLVDAVFAGPRKPAVATVSVLG